MSKTGVTIFRRLKRADPLVNLMLLLLSLSACSADGVESFDGAGIESKSAALYFSADVDWRPTVPTNPPGGSAYHSDCPPGTALVGFSDIKGDPGVVDAVRSVCRHIDSQGHVFGDPVGATYVAGCHGSGKVKCKGTSRPNAMCNDGDVALGLIGYTTDNKRVASLAMYCGRPRAESPAYQVHVAGGVTGGKIAMSAFNRCSPNALMTGVHGRDGLVVDSIGAKCQELLLGAWETVRQGEESCDSACRRAYPETYDKTFTEFSPNRDESICRCGQLRDTASALSAGCRTAASIREAFAGAIGRGDLGTRTSDKLRTYSSFNDGWATTQEVTAPTVVYRATNFPIELRSLERGKLLSPFERRLKFSLPPASPKEDERLRGLLPVDGPLITVQTNDQALLLSLRTLATSSSSEPASQFVSVALTEEVARAFSTDGYVYKFKVNPNSPVLGMRDCSLNTGGELQFQVLGGSSVTRLARKKYGDWEEYDPIAKTWPSDNDKIELRRRLLNAVTGTCLEASWDSTIAMRPCDDVGYESWDVVPQAGGYVKLRHSLTGQCLKASAGLKLGTCSSSSSEDWKSVDSTFINRDSQQCLDADADGRPYLGSCYDDDFEGWRDTATPLRNASNDRCLDSGADGRVYAIACNGGTYQRWDIVDGTMRSVQTGMCLDSNANGHVYTLPCNGGGYQSWDAIGNAWRNRQTGRCLSIDSSGAVHATACSNTAAQKWNVTSIVLRSAQTARCLESDARGSVFTQPCNGGDGQHWEASDNSLRDRETGHCLDSGYDGQVYAIACNGGDYQKWDPVAAGGWRSRETGRCLDGGADGKVYTLACNGGNYQRWR